MILAGKEYQYSDINNYSKAGIAVYMLSNLVTAYVESQNLKRVIVTKKTIADMMITVPMAKNMLPEIDKLLYAYTLQYL